jgi:hypothetical protein
MRCADDGLTLVPQPQVAALELSWVRSRRVASPALPLGGAGLCSARQPERTRTDLNSVQTACEQRRCLRCHARGVLPS